MACKERGRKRKRGEINRAGTGKERWRKGKNVQRERWREKGNKTRRDRGREGDRKDKGKQEGTGGGEKGVRDRRREKENVRELKRREGGKRWKVEQWGKLQLIFCL